MDESHPLLPDPGHRAKLGNGMARDERGRRLHVERRHPVFVEDGQRISPPLHVDPRNRPP